MRRVPSEYNPAVIRGDRIGVEVVEEDINVLQAAKGPDFCDRQRLVSVARHTSDRPIEKQGPVI